MALGGSWTVTTPATATRLASLGAVRDELRVTDPVDDALLTNLLDAASGAVGRFCGRVFARQAYQEVFRDYGAYLLGLTHTPICGVPVVLMNGSPLTDFTVDDARAGVLYRQSGWRGVLEVGWPSSGRLFLADPQQAALNPITVTYVAGYLMPEVDLVTAAVSVDGPSHSFVLASGWPLVQSGDTVRTRQFGTAANNGLFTVQTVAGPTLTVLQTTLQTEAATAVEKQLGLQTVPADLSRAAVLTVASWYRERGRDVRAASKRVGDLQITYQTAQQGDEPAPLPFEVRGLLAAWRRVA